VAGSQILRPWRGRLGAALAVSILTFAGRARAQDVSLPLPPPRNPAASLDDIVDSVAAPEVMRAQTATPGPIHSQVTLRRKW
jgi:hypothetical protein